MNRGEPRRCLNETDKFVWSGRGGRSSGTLRERRGGGQKSRRKEDFVGRSRRICREGADWGCRNGSKRVDGWYAIKKRREENVSVGEVP